MQWEESSKVYSKFVVFIASLLLFSTLTVIAALPALITTMLTTISFSFRSFWFITSLTMFAMMVSYVVYITKTTMKNSTEYKINPWDDLPTSPGVEENVSTNN